MELTHEDFQKAKRISRAIQEYLDTTSYQEVRSTDIYPVLARKGLVEKDRNNGLQFRAFLKHLHSKGVLETLIPQCKRLQGKGNTSEWYFYKIFGNDENGNTELPDVDRDIITPALIDDEIDELIAKSKLHIDRLPKRDTSSFDFNQLELRKLYNRAYEFWSEREIEIMERAYLKFEKVDKVATLLRRQPHVVKDKLVELNLI